MSISIMMDSHERPIQVDDDGAREILRLRAENEQLHEAIASLEDEKEQMKFNLKLVRKSITELQAELREAINAAAMGGE